MPVYLKSVHFCHILRSSVLGDCFEQRMKQSVHVLACMNGLEPAMLDPCQPKHHSKHWMPITVEIGDRSKVNTVILETRIYGSW